MVIIYGIIDDLGTKTVTILKFIDKEIYGYVRRNGLKHIEDIYPPRNKIKIKYDNEIIDKIVENVGNCVKVYIEKGIVIDVFPFSKKKIVYSVIEKIEKGRNL